MGFRVDECLSLVVLPGIQQMEIASSYIVLRGSIGAIQYNAEINALLYTTYKLWCCICVHAYIILDSVFWIP